RVQFSSGGRLVSRNHQPSSNWANGKRYGGSGQRDDFQGPKSLLGAFRPFVPGTRTHRCCGAVAFAWLVCSPAVAYAQATAQIPLQFDFVNPGARSLAMGGAYVAQ